MLIFEYSGWDDPAKLACDFFCQPSVPVPSRFWITFLNEITTGLPDPGRERDAWSLLLPVYRMKWVTILLNDFQPTGNERRLFARPGIDPRAAQQEQLGKAQENLKLI